MAESAFYPASYGGLRLFISQIQTDKSRRQVVHELSDGDGNVIEDKGPKPIVSRVSLLFDKMIGDSLAPLERLRAFAKLVDDKPRIFSHPIEGSFPARVSDFSHAFDDKSNLSGECVITAVGEPSPITPSGPGGIPEIGTGAVASAAAALTIELDELGIESTLPSACAAAVDGWGAAEALNPREVLTQTGSLTSQLADLSASLEADLGMWQAFKATALLAEAVRSAAESATADTAQTMTVRIGAPISLRTLVAMTYGADEADARYLQVMQLNDVENPVSLATGTELVMPQPTPRPRSS